MDPLLPEWHWVLNSSVALLHLLQRPHGGVIELSRACLLWTFQLAAACLEHADKLTVWQQQKCCSG